MVLMKRVAIISENFDMGGMQRVAGVIGKSISNYEDVYYYSMFSKANFYNIDKNFFVGDVTVTQKIKFLRFWRYRKRIDIMINGQYSVAKYYSKDIQLLIDWVKSKKIDTVILCGPFLIAMIPYFKEKIDIKIIGWIHNNYDIYLNEYTRPFNNDYLEGLNRADALVCLTEYDRKKFLKHNANCKLIYNPVTISNNKVSTLTEKNISFTGRVDYKHKGIDFLLLIAALLPKDWTITIAGGGEKKQVKKLKADINKMHLQNRVIFLGPKGIEDLKKHYLNSSIYLMTSRWEGMPLVLAEAMSFGLPIIAFSESGSNEVLKNGDYGILVDNGNINILEKELRRLIKDIELRKEYQEKSIERVKKFDILKISEKWLKLIDSI